MNNPRVSDQLEKAASRFTLAFSALGLNNLMGLQKAGRQVHRKFHGIGEYENGAKPAAGWEEDMLNLGDVTVNLPAKQQGTLLRGLGVAATLAGLSGASALGGGGALWWLLKDKLHPPAIEQPTYVDTDTGLDVTLPKGQVIDAPNR